MNCFKNLWSKTDQARDIAAVATGEAWYGSRALELKLVDSLATSDEYLMQACDDKDVFQVTWKQGTNQSSGC